MYKCDACGQSSFPGQRQVKKVVEVREKEYQYRKGANKKGRSKQFLELHGLEERAKNHDDKGGMGTEIVKEQKLCLKCGAPEEYQKYLEAQKAPKVAEAA